MATITPVASGAWGVQEILWETLTESDTAATISPRGVAPVAGSIQVVGTFGSATVVLQGSNDGTNFATLKDTAGSDISMTATGISEFSATTKFLRPSASGGSSQDVDVYMVLRGAT